MQHEICCIRQFYYDVQQAGIRQCFQVSEVNKIQHTSEMTCTERDLSFTINYQVTTQLQCVCMHVTCLGPHRVLPLHTMQTARGIFSGKSMMAGGMALIIHHFFGRLYSRQTHLLALHQQSIALVTCDICHSFVYK